MMLNVYNKGDRSILNAVPTPLILQPNNDSNTSGK